MQPYSVTACYAFVHSDEASLPELQTELRVFGKKHSMQGLVLIATEGINGTVAGTSTAIAAWKKLLTKHFGEIQFKDSTSEKRINRHWHVKIKKEIVGLHDPSIHPEQNHRHLSPAEWKKVLETEDVVVLDARNDYETEIGKFRGAVDPNINSFHQFRDYVKRSEIPKDKKVLMYCTGGIRCEKALPAMEAQGYKNVYQLSGGILAYLEAFPNDAFEGECFIFDQRLALDQKLQPTEIYGLCPHCGYAGDIEISCVCGTQKKICKRCARIEERKTCSKHCRNSLRKRLVA